MALSKAIVKIMRKPRYFIGAIPIYSMIEVGDRVKAKGFATRIWEPGLVIEIDYMDGLYGKQVTGVALIKWDNPDLGTAAFRIERLQYEHSEEELVEQVLGDYFA